MQLLDALADPEKITMVQIAPAVRTAWGESVGLYREESTLGKLVAALKQIGFDYVFDTGFTADLTIMEEGSEFLQHFGEKDKHKWPLFTSCCPGWVRFVKNEFPGICRESFYCKISAADVRRHEQDIYRTEAGRGSGKDLFCFHHALYGEEI